MPSGKPKQPKVRHCVYCGSIIKNHNGLNTMYCTVVCQILKRTGGTGDPDGCWVWLGPNGRREGRGAIVMRSLTNPKRGKSMRVGRAMYIAEHGEPPPFFDVIEKCGTKGCVNPKHLGIRPHRDSIVGSNKARATKKSA